MSKIAKQTQNGKSEGLNVNLTKTTKIASPVQQPRNRARSTATINLYLPNSRYIMYIQQNYPTTIIIWALTIETRT
ncbi:MAG: hypothetical protein ACT6FD_02615 [Methanosarcinaceae archaeon]